MKTQYSKQELINILESPQLIEYILNKLKKYPSTKIMTKPRIPFKKDESWSNADKDSNNQSKKNKQDPDRDYFFKEDFNFFKQDSVIAGGSIAAWINEYLYKVPATINDIDIFYYKFDSNEKDQLESEFYEGMIDEDRFQYEVQKVTEEGVYNKIKFMPTNEFCWEYLLESFDLNCCQIGLNLAHKSLFFSKDYLNFLETKIIDYNPSYEFEDPLMTFIRGQLKSKELKVKYYLGEHLIDFYINKYPKVISYDDENDDDDIFTSQEHHLNHHTTPFILKTVKHEVCEDDELFISAKRLELLHKNPTLLEPWLIFDKENNSLNFGEIYKNYHWHDFLLTLCSESNDPKKSKKAKFYFDGLTELDYARKIPIFNEKISTLNNIKHFVFSNFVESDSTARAIASLSNKKTYLFRDKFSLNELKNLSENFLKEHNEFQKYTWHLMDHYNYSIIDMINFYKNIKNLNPALLGYVGTFLQELLRNPNAVKYNQIITFLKNKEWNQFFEILEKEHKLILDKDFLCEPLDISPFNKWVKELTKNSELTYEGQKMNHCVGGYGSKLKNGESKIFTITIRGVPSTLELLLTKNEYTPKTIPKKYMTKNAQNIREKRKSKIEYSYSLGQNRAKHNYKPSSSHVKVAELLIKYLNNLN